MGNDYQAMWNKLKGMLQSESIDPCDYCNPKLKCQCSVCDPTKGINEEIVLNVMKKIEGESDQNEHTA